MRMMYFAILYPSCRSTRSEAAPVWDGKGLVVHLIGEDRLRVKCILEVDALVIFALLPFHRIGAVEHDVTSIRLQPDLL